MKLFNALAVAVALLAGTAAQAQTVEEIVAKHNDAIGGVALWKKVKSMKITGNINAQGQTINVVVSQLQDKGARTDINIAGTNNYIILTPTAGWQFWPVGQMTKPEPMTADELKDAQEELDIQDPMIDYATKGNKVELLGKEDIEGTECFKLKVTRKSGKAITTYIDPKTFYTLREVEKKTADGKEVEEVSNYGNYQKLPEGIIFPMSVDKGQGQMVVTAVEINTIKDESIFKPSSN